MDPPISVSVTRTSPGRWNLGSTMVCEQLSHTEPRPDDTITDWQDGDSIFYLRQRTAHDTLGGDAEVDRIHVGGTSAAVWCLGGNAFCKAHAWREGLQLEADNIRFVQAHAPEVPVPEVLFSWIDHDLDRTFLITRRASGRTLEQAWPQLSSNQRAILARDVARFCVSLAANTSSRFQTVNGCGVWESRLMEDAPPSHPTWLPRMLGPFSREDMQAHMAHLSTQPCPDIDPLFCLYHADLGPTNIMVAEDTNLVSAIIDWESLAYYPRFWVASKPAFSGVFHLECETEDPKLWGQLLGQALEDGGFKRQDAAFLQWYSGRKE